MARTHLAVDIGASSGRCIVGYLDGGRLVTREVYRFDSTQVRVENHDCWDLSRLVGEITAGLKAAKTEGFEPETIGIDTWGVDFVLVDESGADACLSVAYRDARTDGAEHLVEDIVPRGELYRRTGIQHQKFNTIYQLAALRKEHPDALNRAARMLMIPEYLAYKLTGVMKSEYTNASTTGLLDAGARGWDFEIIDRLGYPRRIFGHLEQPGTTVGALKPEVAAEVGYDSTVVLVGSHDTASAYLAAPIERGDEAIISSGTWSLLGMELAQPMIDDRARERNFTNEGGVGGKIRFLKNIMGLWIIQNIRRELNGDAYVEGRGKPAKSAKRWSYAELESAARQSSYAHTFDADADELLAPEDMCEAVWALLKSSGAEQPRSVGDLMRSVYLSLAKCYAAAIDGLGEMTGSRPSAINIVGGGSRDRLLNELTAKECGLVVRAGPSEATAIGNLLAQLIASGECKDAADAREIVKKSCEIEVF